MAPRRGRGGRRQGQPGQAYGNRKDLNQAPRATSGGREYGEKGAAEQRQQAAPLPRQAAPPTPTQAASALAPRGPLPLTAPSTMPGQPVTAGLPIGAGAGPDILGASMGSQQPVTEQLLALYRQYPTPDLARIVERLT